MQPPVEYLGHIVDSQGQHANPRKVRAVTETLVYWNVTESSHFSL